jgi:hypothetical protein
MPTAQRPTRSRARVDADIQRDANREQRDFDGHRERRESGVPGIDASMFPAEEKENRPENVAEQGRGEEQRERSARREFLRAKADSEVLL